MMIKKKFDMENITPKESMKALSRSRKCLDLAKGTSPDHRLTPNRALKDHNMLLTTPPSTPVSTNPNYDLILSSSDVSASPCTPKPRAVRSVTKSSKKRLIRSTIKKEVVKQIPEPVKDDTPIIVCSNFYSNSTISSDKNDMFDSMRVTGSILTPSVKSQGNTSVRSVPGPSRSSQRPPRRRTTSSLRRSTGGVKRKRSLVRGGGVGHSIKKPKLRHSTEPVKIKISELPVLSVEIPKYDKKPESVTPTTSPPSEVRSTTSRSAPSITFGQIDMTRQTKVDYEVKGGQFVYRAKPKAGITPLRRSPRKHYSPLKADYFSGRKSDGLKTPGPKILFSPSNDYLDHSNANNEECELPSPVKFHDSSQDDSVPDLSNIIASLGDTRDHIDQSYEEMSQNSELALNMAPSVVNSNMNSAVSNILCDLSSGADDSTDSQFDTSTNKSIDNDETAGELFSIFYKTGNIVTDNDKGDSISSATSKKFICSNLSTDQTVLDAGQKVLGPTVCPTCGAVYSVGDPEDELTHSKVHSGYLERLKHVGWKSERVVGQFSVGRVVSVRPGDSPAWWRKVEEILLVVDKDLGFSEVGIRAPEKTKVFLFLADKKVVGLLLAEEIDKGYRILPNNDSGSNKVYCSSTVAEPVKCGISRIWVLSDYRRKKIATSLVDSMRSSFFVNHYLTESEFAFSDPTLSGIEFAGRYCKQSQFLVYSR